MELLNKTFSCKLGPKIILRNRKFEQCNFAKGSFTYYIISCGLGDEEANYLVQ